MPRVWDTAQRAQAACSMLTRGEYILVQDQLLLAAASVLRLPLAEFLEQLESAMAALSQQDSAIHKLAAPKLEAVATVTRAAMDFSHAIRGALPILAPMSVAAGGVCLAGAPEGCICRRPSHGSDQIHYCPGDPESNHAPHVWPWP